MTITPVRKGWVFDPPSRTFTAQGARSLGFVGPPYAPRCVQLFLDGFLQGFPDTQLTAHRMVADEDTVAVHFTAIGHQTGDFAGMPPTGRPVAMPATAIYRLAGGKIVEDWEVMDRVVILQQIGMIPA